MSTLAQQGKYLPLAFCKQGQVKPLRLVAGRARCCIPRCCFSICRSGRSRSSSVCAGCWSCLFWRLLRNSRSDSFRFFYRCGGCSGRSSCLAHLWRSTRRSWWCRGRWWLHEWRHAIVHTWLHTEWNGWRHWIVTAAIISSKTGAVTP